MLAVGESKSRLDHRRVEIQSISRAHCGDAAILIDAVLFIAAHCASPHQSLQRPRCLLAARVVAAQIIPAVLSKLDGIDSMKPDARLPDLK
jgi:hypothetical protein